MPRPPHKQHAAPPRKAGPTADEQHERLAAGCHKVLLAFEESMLAGDEKAARIYLKATSELAKLCGAYAPAKKDPPRATRAPLPATREELIALIYAKARIGPK